MTIDHDALSAAFSWISSIDNSSGQVCKLDANGKPVEILFEFGCATCSEVASKNAEEYGNALVTIFSAARALLSERDKLRAALIGLVGAERADELRAMEAAMRLVPAPAADKAAMIDAIHALLDEGKEGSE